MDELFYEVLEMLDDLLVGIEAPALTTELWTSTDLLQRAARLMGKRVEAEWRMEVIRGIDHFYRRADGLSPRMIIPETVADRLRRVVILCSN